ncbi:MAG: molybdopterin-dependent oxidoreductase [Solirubrobacterales bacterium]
MTDTTETIDTTETTETTEAIAAVAAAPDAPEWQPTACILCECNCGIEVQLEGRTLTRIRGDKAHPASEGYTCNKAMRLDHYQNGTHRLTSPLRRRSDGTYEEISWDDAISEIATGFQRIAGEHGGESIFYYGGGGQGNHLGGAYSGAFLKALGSRYRSSALAQEKTGEAWVDSQIYGGHTRGEFEHAEVSVFVGKNPWMSQSFPRARVVLREIAKDPERSMIVIDPVATDTAKLADFHLRVRPGADAWCLAALAATLVQEDLADRDFLADHVNGAEPVLAALATVPIADYAERCGVAEELIRAAARRIATADSVAVFEDLGVQQGPDSTLCSYLNKMLWILTGSFAKPGGQHMHSWMAPLMRPGRPGRTPVTGAPVIGGLTPCNVIPDEILSDHPDRFRAMIVESSNPAHSLADSERMREAFEALELLVVVDVAMTETARLADYVLPAATQFEKAEATFFNLEFPRNTFHLRHPLLEPLEGTLPEPEIWARLVRALGLVDDAVIERLRAAAGEGRGAYAQALGEATGSDPSLIRVLPFLLYETLGPTLPDGLAGAAALWGLCQRVAMTYPHAMRRAGHDDGDALFDAILAGRSGVTFTLDEYEDDWSYVTHPDGRFALEIPELLEDLRGLEDRSPGYTDESFPVVLSAGERRAYTANDIIRDPSWRKRDTDGALRVSDADAELYGLTDGGRALITTARGSAEATVEVSELMQPGHVSLPNGFGVDHSSDDGETVIPGVAPNTLTSSGWRDPYAGTPWHKHVPARIEPLAVR